MSDAVTTKKDKGQKPYQHAVGRRREAVARIRLHKEMVVWESLEVKAGDVIVNNMPFEEYFKSETASKAYQDILKSTNTATKFGYTIKVSGGGKVGQLEAVLHGMARALSELDSEKYRPVLKKKGLLTRDPRTRQRRKVGMGGKSRRKRQSPKR